MVNLERLSENRVKLVVTVSAEQFDAALDAAFEKVVKEVKVDGFRPGKLAYQQLVEIPTNYQQYFFSYLKICDMYETVSNHEGDLFDVKKFHKTVLDCGPAPLRYVEDKVYGDYGIK